MSKTVIVVGDGPAGLSAALFLAKNGFSTTVFGNDQTAMHWAKLHNYLGIPEITGTDFQRIARDQISDFGAELIDELIVAVAVKESGFRLHSEEGRQYDADYVVIAEGKGRKLTRTLNLEETENGIAVDADFRTAIDGLYVIGRTTRTARSQAIISAGHGATAAIDIISRERNQDFQDFDEA